MEGKCSYGLLLEQECHKLSYTRKIGLKKLADIANDTCQVLLWRAGLLHTIKDVTRDGTICLHHEFLFGSKFERKEKKCCDVFQKHKKKAVGIHKVTLHLARDLKEKGISVTPGQKFCRNCYEMVVKEGSELNMLKQMLNIVERNHRRLILNSAKRKN